MKNLNRRKFLKWSGIGVAVVAIDPLALIPKGKQLIFRFRGGDFYYRIPSLGLKKQWLNESTTYGGAIDFYKWAEKAISWCLTGWNKKAVVSTENKPISFNVNIIPLLPEDFQCGFLDAVFS